ncbi:unnamed protein product, partial [Durusdinium trenchii]
SGGFGAEGGGQGDLQRDVFRQSRAAVPTCRSSLRFRSRPAGLPGAPGGGRYSAGPAPSHSGRQGGQPAARVGLCLEEDGAGFQGPLQDLQLPGPLSEPTTRGLRRPLPRAPGRRARRSDAPSSRPER